MKLPEKIQPTEYYQVTTGDDYMLCVLPEEHAIRLSDAWLYEKFILGPNTTMTLYGIGGTAWTTSSLIGEIYYYSSKISHPSIKERVYKWIKDFTPFPGG